MGKNRIRIIQYHRICDLPETDDVMSFLGVTIRAFDDQMDFLYRNGFNVITLEELIDCKENNLELPLKTIVLTFDDGFRDNYINAFPILEKYKLKGTFFLVTDCIGSDKIFHWLKLGKPSLDHARDNEQYWLPLKRKDILAMDAQGACFGSHSKNHNSLIQLNESTAMEELRGSKEYLEELLQKPVRCFCYPFGDENQSVNNLIQVAGYNAAVTTEMGSNTLNSDFLRLRRIPVNDQDSLAKFSRKVEGAYDWWFRWILPIVIGILQVVKKKRNG